MDYIFDNYLIQTLIIHMALVWGEKIKRGQFFFSKLSNEDKI